MAVPAGQERRVVTVLFADVTGSTGLAERLDPEHLQEVMASYFGAMRQAIEAEGGTVEKFIGDAVMAAFGVPSAHEERPIAGRPGGPGHASGAERAERWTLPDARDQPADADRPQHRRGARRRQPSTR
jgi:class 3 adenylate cyclase